MKKRKEAKRETGEFCRLIELSANSSKQSIIHLSADSFTFCFDFVASLNLYLIFLHSINMHKKGKQRQVMMSMFNVKKRRKKIFWFFARRKHMEDLARRWACTHLSSAFLKQFVIRIKFVFFFFVKLSFNFNLKLNVKYW